ncbi:MAG TPA: NAD-dependent epimerase/dehydratase family protein [Acidimicrobiales bacterium]|nr:NAD-dependent epimerase/dehydratase family protein [Acidimicrobiales bacterium]
MGKRVLITGLGSFWGGRMAQALEKLSGIDTIIGLDVTEPRVPLERTEYVRADQSYSILSRIVRATEVDTIVHTFLVVDSTHMSGRALHETNVIGTMNLLAAAGAPDSSVRHLIVKSSSLVYGSSMHDPVWFRESMTRSHPPQTRVERSLIEVEGYLRDFADDNPHVVVSLLRFTNVLGTDIVTPISSVLERGVAPAITGFDPLVQFVEEDDVIRSLLFALDRELPGVFNVAGDGRVPWSEVASICGARLLPILPPVLTGVAATVLGGLRVMDLPPEVLDLLRYGRGIDNRRLKQAGFRYHYTSAGAVENFARSRRLKRTIGETRPNYTYERDVEAFFRRSPAVVRHPEG